MYTSATDLVIFCWDLPGSGEVDLTEATKKTIVNLFVYLNHNSHYFIINIL